ncbi:MAG TPA: TylF/MycF/NovP-related O-methyltransferase [Rugosimonospora sp.]|nr:TylF/MycF/NovP-related O-methyltransferase [Rugosimonospora sp.]
MSADLGLGPAFTDGPEGPDRSLLAHVLSLEPAGWAVEFGVGKGETLRMIAAVMPVIGADSELGLPEDWRPEFRKGAFRHKMPEVPGTTLLPGWFEDTLPDYDWPDQLGLVHLDADLYSSTATALASIGPYIKPGCYVVLDEWFGYEGCEDHEQRAWHELVERTGITTETIGHGREQLALLVTGRAA